MHLRAPDVPFLDAEVVLDTSVVTTPFAFLGIPYGPPYRPEDMTDAAGAADAVRTCVRRMEYASAAHHHDFDLDGPLFHDGHVTVTDCGNVVGDDTDPGAIWDRAIDVVRPLVERGVTPLVMGGLDAIPPIVAEPFAAAAEPLHVLHVDAHLDFRDEVGGERRGYSSPIRRIREMRHVGEIVQVGLRAVGSGRPSDVRDAIGSGNVLVKADEVHAFGVASVVDRLQRIGGRWMVTIDCDGLDPSIAPGVGWPEPGGLTFPQISTIVRALARRSSIAALVVTEYQPDRDIAGITALTVARLFLNTIGLQRRSG
ncbi:MAG TPA: arginase family protein [Actinomycetota bacterium]|nr:arginase family protein [Actinomycetota bacterium]